MQDFLGAPEKHVMNSGAILAIQHFFFSNQGGELVKDETLVSWTQCQPAQDLTAPLTIEHEVLFMSSYYLIATINHPSTLNTGHYWACIKDLHSPCW